MSALDTHGWFTWLSLGASGLLVASAALSRGRAFALFLTFLLGIHCFATIALEPFVGSARPVFAFLQAAVFLHFGSLLRPRLRTTLHRFLISWPGSYFAAASFLALPWAIAATIGATPWGLPVPFLVAAVGMFQSLRHRTEHVTLHLDGTHAGALGRWPKQPPAHARAVIPPVEALRIVQLTDPHLGPFMSERRLRALTERAVANEPHLVLLTGDFLTMESQLDSASLTRALEPLRQLPGRVFACLGNHDHEALDTVVSSLAAIGAHLLVDGAVTVETPAGPVQLVGMDFHFRDRRARMAAVCKRFPRVPGHLRLVLLHDPGAFRHLENGDADIVFSGHTHGGQLGLLSLGLPHTFISAFTSMPDHGFWALGANRLYVHRGTGHYGFPLRVGVPSEESVILLHRATDRV